jgi:hypothetical protein
MLSLHVAKAPETAVKIVRDSVAILETVLNNLSCDGIWTLSFIKQCTKRVNIKFQLVRKEDSYGSQALRIRTKPGDNGTCWESLLFPPSNYSIDSIGEALKMVHPYRLQPLAKINTIEKLKIVKEELDEVEAEVERRKSQPEVQKPEPEPIKVISSLELAHDSDGIGTDPIALNKGLLALEELFGIQKVLSRHVVMTAITTKLNLENFCKNHFKYDNVIRCASLIVKGLCDNEFINRIGKYEATKFEITDVGSEWLSRLKIDGPNVVPVEETEEEEVEVEVVNPPPPNEFSLSNIKLATPLVYEHDKLLNSIKEYESWIADTEEELGEQDAKVREIDELLLPLMQRRTEALKKKEELTAQIEEFKQTKLEDEKKIAQIKADLKRLFENV